MMGPFGACIIAILALGLLGLPIGYAMIAGSWVLKGHSGVGRSGCDDFRNPNETAGMKNDRTESVSDIA